MAKNTGKSTTAPKPTAKKKKQTRKLSKKELSGASGGGMSVEGDCPWPAS